MLKTALKFLSKWKLVFRMIYDQSQNNVYKSRRIYKQISKAMTACEWQVSV